MALAHQNSQPKRMVKVREEVLNEYNEVVSSRYVYAEIDLNKWKGIVGSIGDGN